MKSLDEILQGFGVTATSPMNTLTSSSTEPRDLSREACPICHGTGWVVRDVPIGHPDFGRAFPCRCKEAEIEQRRQARLRALGNLGALQHMTFDSFLPDGIGLPEDRRRNLRDAYETARRFAERPEGWLLLLGGYGCGKTHLAAAIAHARLARGDAVLFISIPDLLDYLRATFNPTSEVGYDERLEMTRQEIGRAHV